jgi:hypothetical protein
VYDDIKLPATNANFVMKGYRQSFRYFQHYAPEIKSKFAFAQEYHSDASTFMHECADKKGATAASSTWIGVHIRLGDSKGMNANRSFT